jgi:hypothetical protein
MTIENKLPKFTAESSLFRAADFNNSYTPNAQTNDMNVIPQDRSRRGHCVGPNGKAVTLKEFGIEKTCDAPFTVPWITLRTNGDIDSGCGICIDP